MSNTTLNNFLASNFTTQTFNYANNIYLNQTKQFGGDVTGSNGILAVVNTSGLHAGNITLGIFSKGLFSPQVYWANGTGGLSASNLTTGTLSSALFSPQVYWFNSTTTLSWANITKPSACASGQYVTDISGASLTCSVPINNISSYYITATNPSGFYNTTHNITSTTNPFYYNMTNNTFNYMINQSLLTTTGTTFGGEVTGLYNALVLSHTALNDIYIQLGNTSVNNVIKNALTNNTGINATILNATKIISTTQCFIETCLKNITYNGTNILIYG